MLLSCIGSLPDKNRPVTHARLCWSLQTGDALAHGFVVVKELPLMPIWIVVQALSNQDNGGAVSESDNEEMEVVGDMGQDFWQKGAGESSTASTPGHYH